MGFLGINLNKKVQEIFARTAGEKQDDVKISKYIEQCAAEMGISEEVLTKALMSNIWAVSENPFSDGADGADLTPVNSVDIAYMLEKARNDRTTALAASAGGIPPAAFADLAAADTTHTSANPGGQTHVDVVTENSGKAVAAAQAEAGDAENKKNNAQSGVRNAEQKAANDNAKAGQNVANAKSAAAATEAKGNAEIDTANNNAKNENEKAKIKYKDAQANTETVRKSSEQAISDANSKSAENNKTAENELNNAKSKKSGIEQNIADLETKIADAEKNVSKLKEVMDDPDATENDVEAYNKAVKELRELEDELETAQEEDKKAEQAVSDAEEKVNKTKQEGEEYIKKITEEENAKVKIAEEAEKAALGEMTQTERSGQNNVAGVTATAQQNNASAKASVTAAQTEAGQVEYNGKDAVAKANNTLSAANNALAKAEKKVKNIKADGEKAVAAAKKEEQNPTSQSGVNPSEKLAQNIASRGGDSGAVKNLQASSAEPQEENSQDADKMIANLNAARSSARNPLGLTPKADIRRTAQQIAAQQHNNDSLEEDSANPDYPLKKKPNNFGI